MKKSATAYIFEALKFLRTNSSYLIILIFLKVSFYLSPLIPPNLLLPFFKSIGLVLFIITPLIYGQYVEILNTGSKQNWIYVLKVYWVTVFLINIVLSIPVIPIVIFAPEAKMMKVLVSFLIEIASIYILPVALLKKEVVHSIKLGFKCLIYTFKFSTPLIFTLVFSFLLLNLTDSYVKTDTILPSIIISLFNNFVSTIIEFTLLIAAILILKDNLINEDT